MHACFIVTTMGLCLFRRGTQGDCDVVCGFAVAWYDMANEVANYRYALLAKQQTGLGPPPPPPRAMSGCQTRALMAWAVGAWAGTGPSFALT